MTTKQNKAARWLLSSIGALPPDMPYARGSRGKQRVYKLLPAIAGVLFSILGILELKYIHSATIFIAIVITTLWCVYIFFLIAFFMQYPNG
jgi:hypothetical protein